MSKQDSYSVAITVNIPLQTIKEIDSFKESERLTRGEIIVKAWDAFKSSILAQKGA